MVIQFLTLVYIGCLLLLALYSLGQLVLLIQYLRLRHHNPVTPGTVSEWPHVTVQLPVYNEQHVVLRLLDAVLSIDYPRDRLHIQLLDDSTDVTTRLLASRVAVLRAEGWQIQHIHRHKRLGYKAGALQRGLRHLHTGYIAIFDADFVPPPHFLKAVLPHLLADEGLAVVQSAWGHLNADANWLTRAQQLATDAHFVIEQTARSRSGWIVPFNGTGGVWRVAAIHDAGGWSADTLTEDCDLSYRAQLAGWRALYLPQVVVPGELPPQLAAYRRQQGRWAQGNTQCLRKHGWQVLTQPMPMGQRMMALHHLCQYLPQTWMLLSLLVLPPLMLADVRVTFAPLGIIGLIPPLLYFVSQQALSERGWLRLWALPVLIVVATGLIAHNSLAVLRGLMQRGGTFERTPKFADVGHISSYALPSLSGHWLAATMAAYATMTVLIAWRTGSAMLPYGLLYGVAFNAVLLAGLVEEWWLRRKSAPQQAATLSDSPTLAKRTPHR